MKPWHRFRDEEGRWVDARGLVYAPHAFWTTLLRRALGYYSRRPWLSYRFVRWLEKSIQDGWSVLEFGSGMSTIWLAERCRSVHSIESDENWYRCVSAFLRRRGFKNVHYELRTTEEYNKIKPADGHYDFALIDGDARRDCLATALRYVKDGGWIYLDNTDATGPYHQPAEDLLVETAKQTNTEIRYFIDFAPGQFFVTQGALLRKKGL